MEDIVFPLNISYRLERTDLVVVDLDVWELVEVWLLDGVLVAASQFMVEHLPKLGVLLVGVRVIGRSLLVSEILSRSVLLLRIEVQIIPALIRSLILSRGVHLLPELVPVVVMGVKVPMWRPSIWRLSIMSHFCRASWGIHKVVVLSHWRARRQEESRRLKGKRVHTWGWRRGKHIRRHHRHEHRHLRRVLILVIWILRRHVLLKLSLLRVGLSVTIHLLCIAIDLHTSSGR